MATSSTYTETRTAAHLFTDALLELGVIALGDTPSADQYAFATRRINDILFQMRGPNSPFQKTMNMWTRERGTLTLSAKASYSLKPSGGDLAIQVPDEIIALTLKDSDDQETPIDFMSVEEYWEITDKDATGTPARCYAEKGLAETKLYFDVIPEDITCTVRVLYRQPIEIITASTQEFDVEPYFYRVLMFSLAVDMAPAMLGDVPASLLTLMADAHERAQTFNQPEVNFYFRPGVDE